MSEATDILKQMIDYVQTAPPVVLIILFLNAVGLMLKRSSLPNNAIPWVIVLIGAVLTSLLAPVPTGRNPMLLLALMGCLFGVIAWLAHALILRRLEKFLPAGFLPEDNKNPETKP